LEEAGNHETRRHGGLRSEGEAERALCGGARFRQNEQNGQNHAAGMRGRGWEARCAGGGL